MHLSAPLLTLVASIVSTHAVFASAIAAKPIEASTASAPTDSLGARKGFKLYCNLIGLSSIPCEAKFNGVNLDKAGHLVVGAGEGGDGQIGGYVARKAANECIRKFNLQENAALMGMFQMSMKRKDQYATAAGPTQGGGKLPRPNNGKWYSDDARREAHWRAYSEKSVEMFWQRKLDHSGNAGLPGVEPGDKASGMSGAGFALLTFIYNEHLAWEASASAENAPWEWGVEPDKSPESWPGPKVDSPKEFLEHDGESISGTSPPSESGHSSNDDSASASLDESPDHEDDEDQAVFEPTTDEDFEAIPDGVDTGSDIDIEEDINATPILDDFDTKTAMQKCQEGEERDLWKQIGSEEIDPDAAIRQMGEKDRADALLSIGVCDPSYYSRQDCQKFKNKQWEVPLDPEMEQHLIEWHKLNPPCPVNLVQERACHKAQQKMYKRYDINHMGDKVLGVIARPGAPIRWLPDLKRNPVRVSPPTTAAGGHPAGVAGLPGKSSSFVPDLSNVPLFRGVKRGSASSSLAGLPHSPKSKDRFPLPTFRPNGDRPIPRRLTPFKLPLFPKPNSAVGAAPKVASGISKTERDEL